jgi:hypothetical protein
MIDSTTFFCKEVANNDTQQLRAIVKNTGKTIPPVFEKLNQASLRQGINVNVLATMTKLNPNNNIFVEMPISLNYINMYSIDSSVCKTICIGKSLDNIKKIENTEQWSRLYTFSYLELFNDFWGVLHINEDWKTYRTERKKFPSILLFDWQGEPIAELKLNNFITSFDIDFINGHLYTHDILSDEFYMYDIKSILDAIGR